MQILGRRAAGSLIVVVSLALASQLTVGGVFAVADADTATAAKAKGKKKSGKKKGKARCPKAKVRLRTGGKAKCVKPKAVKPIKSKKSAGLQRAEFLIGGVKLPPIKLVRKGKSYGTYRGPLSKSAQKRLLKAVAATEKKVKAGLLAQARKLPATEEGAAASASASGVSATAPGASASAVVRGANAGGLDSFEIEFNKETGGWSGKGSGKADVTLDNGAKATVEVTAKAEGNSASLGEPDMEIGVKVETNDGPSVTGMTFKMKVPPVTHRSAKQSCPAADGSVKHDTSMEGGETSTYLADRIGPIEIDSVTTTFSMTGGMKSDYTMTENSRLPARLPFKTNVKFGYSVVAKILGIKVQNIRVNATGTAAGAIDSKTGEIGPGASMDVKVNISGIPAAQVQTSMTSATLSLMRSAIGRLHAEAKAIEKKALQGDCTKIVFKPKSDTEEMAKGEKLEVEAKLETKQGKTVAEPVRVLATASVGQVSYDQSARDNPAKVKVTAGDSKTSPAVVQVSLISRAGVSRETWKAKDSPFPKRYSGSMSYQYVYTPVPQSTVTMSGKATATYELKSTLTNPDGSKHGLYEAISASMSEIGHKEETSGGEGGCTSVLVPNPRPPVSEELRFGDIDMRISPTGQWSAGFTLDVDPGMMPARMTCDGMPPVDFEWGPHFGLNSRLKSIPGLRPMSPAGPIEGSGVTDLQVTMQPGFTATGTWSLQPQK